MRQNGKSTEQDAKSFRAIIKMADENPGITQRFVVASAKETKYYDIVRVKE